MRHADIPTLAKHVAQRKEAGQLLSQGEAANVAAQLIKGGASAETGLRILEELLNVEGLTTPSLWVLSEAALHEEEAVLGRAAELQKTAHGVAFFGVLMAQETLRHHGARDSIAARVRELLGEDDLRHALMWQHVESRDFDSFVAASQEMEGEPSLVMLQLLVRACGYQALGSPNEREKYMQLARDVLEQSGNVPLVEREYNAMVARLSKAAADGLRHQQRGGVPKVSVAVAHARRARRDLERVLERLTAWMGDRTGVPPAVAKLAVEVRALVQSTGAVCDRAVAELAEAIPLAQEGAYESRVRRGSLDRRLRKMVSAVKLCAAHSDVEFAAMALKKFAAGRVPRMEGVLEEGKAAVCAQLDRVDGPACRALRERVVALEVTPGDAVDETFAGAARAAREEMEAHDRKLEDEHAVGAKRDLVREAVRAGRREEAERHSAELAELQAAAGLPVLPRELRLAVRDLEYLLQLLKVAGSNFTDACNTAETALARENSRRKRKTPASSGEAPAAEEDKEVA